MENRRLLSIIHCTPVDMESLLEVFPDAQIITVHRDPVQVMKSACELQNIMGRSLKRVFFDDRIGVGRRVLNEMKLDCRKMIEWRKNENFKYIKDDKENLIERFIDVQFKDLIKKPIETIEQIYEKLDVKFDNQAKTNMEIYLKNKNTSHRKKDNNIQQYGLSEELVRKEFKPYTEFFNVK